MHNRLQKLAWAIGILLVNLFLIGPAALSTGWRANSDFRLFYVSPKLVFTPDLYNPDAVIRGSRIWDGKGKEERAASNKIEADDVEEFYRKRSMLKKSVLPEDIAEAVYFFASEKAGKSTGNIINVDAGNAAAFTR